MWVCVCVGGLSSLTLLSPHYRVTGQSYSPLDGEVKGLGDDGVTEHDAALMDISKVCCLCNDSKLE